MRKPPSGEHVDRPTVADVSRRHRVAADEHAACRQAAVLVGSNETVTLVIGRPTVGHLVDRRRCVKADPARFGRAVERMDLDPEPLPETATAVARSSGAPADISVVSEGGQPSAGGCAPEVLNMNGTPGNTRAPTARASARQPLRHERLPHDDRRALQQQRQDQVAEPVRVRQRDRGDWVSPARMPIAVTMRSVSLIIVAAGTPTAFGAPLDPEVSLSRPSPG